MLAALLVGFLVFSGGNGFAAKMFGKDTRALVRQVVADPERADAAVQELELGQQDLEAIGKRFEKIVKEFSATDEDQAAGFDDLLPYMQLASEQRRNVQRVSLDRMFDLREILTEDEWNALFAKLKDQS
jgi:ribosome-binding ATPase YchF (GTP1/OBG family)